MRCEELWLQGLRTYESAARNIIHGYASMCFLGFYRQNRCPEDCSPYKILLSWYDGEAHKLYQTCIPLDVLDTGAHTVSAHSEKAPPIRNMTPNPGQWTGETSGVL